MYEIQNAIKLKIRLDSLTILTGQFRSLQSCQHGFAGQQEEKVFPLTQIKMLLPRSTKTDRETPHISPYTQPTHSHSHILSFKCTQPSIKLTHCLICITKLNKL